jgi:hypothetical protein
MKANLLSKKEKLSFEDLIGETTSQAFLGGIYRDFGEKPTITATFNAQKEFGPPHTVFVPQMLQDYSMSPILRSESILPVHPRASIF